MKVRDGDGRNRWELGQGSSRQGLEHLGMGESDELEELQHLDNINDQNGWLNEAEGLRKAASN